MEGNNGESMEGCAVDAIILTGERGREKYLAFLVIQVNIAPLNFILIL